jgi:hypothetical protein
MRKGQAVGHGLGHPGVQPPVGPRSLHPFGVAVRDRSVTGYRSRYGTTKIRFVPGRRSLRACP